MAFRVRVFRDARARWANVFASARAKASACPPACTGVRPGARRLTARWRGPSSPGLQDRDPVTLSSGQRARTALKLFLAEPLTLLLDERFSKLGATLRDDIHRFMITLVKTRAIPALTVTHDPDDAAAAMGAMIALQLPEAA